MGYSVVGGDVNNINEEGHSEIKKSIKKNSKGETILCCSSQT